MECQLFRMEAKTKVFYLPDGTVLKDVMIIKVIRSKELILKTACPFNWDSEHMSQAFEISYWWEHLSKPGYCVEMVDATRVFISLNYFLSIYEEEFVIHVQEHDACFDLRPDLSTIFEDIPVVLKQLTTDTKSPVEFDFFEEGTAVGILME